MNPAHGQAEMRDAHFLDGMAMLARRVSTAPFELPSLEDVRRQPIGGP